MVSGGAEARVLSKSYWLLAIAFAVLIIVLAMLGQFGLPDKAVGVIVIAVSVVTYSRSVSSRDHAACRLLRGRAGRAAGLQRPRDGGLRLGDRLHRPRRRLLRRRPGALTLVIGWAVGFLLLAVAVAPYFRKSGALTLPDFFAIRFGGR